MAFKPDSPQPTGELDMKPTVTGRLQRLVRALPRQLASVRLGSVLVIATLALTLVAAFFPGYEAAGLVRSIGKTLEFETLSQASQLSFQERFESPPFILLILAMSLSLCFSLYFRVKNELRRRRAEAAALAQEAGRPQPGAAAGAAIAAVERVLRQRGYRTRATAWRVYGGKGGAGVWGSVLFHIGILLILAAVLLSAVASFSASIKLTEGQAFDARVDRYGVEKAGRWYEPPPQALSFRLVRVEPDYELNGATTTASIVEPTLEGRTSRFLAPAPVHISNGLRHAGVTIHQGRGTGYAPRVIVEDAAGARLLDGYMQLATMSGPDGTSYLDSFAVKGKDVLIEFELLPDAVYRGGAYLSRSAAPKNPVLHVVVRERGKPALDQFIPITRDVSAGGYTVFFGDLRRWSQLDVSDAPGVPVLIAGTLLGTLGLALRLLWVRRRVVVTLHEAVRDEAPAFEIAGSSEKFQQLFKEELDALRAALSERLAAPVQPARDDAPTARLASGGNK